MSRKEFAVWLACLLLITLGAAILCVWMLPGCNAAAVAESAEVGVGHSHGDLDWSNSQRSADTQSNSVWLSVHPFAGAFDEPRDPVWGDLHYPREWPDADGTPVTQPVPVVVTVPSAPEPPKSDDDMTLIVSSISAVVVAAVGVWQRRSIVAGVKTIRNKVTGSKPAEGE